MINLSDRNTALKITTSASGDVHYSVSYSKFVNEFRMSNEQAHNNITTATTTTILQQNTNNALPHWHYKVDSIFVKNADAASNTVMLRLVTSSEDTELTSAITLAAEEFLILSANGLSVYSANGVEKQPSTNKMLGQAAPSATTETDLYTVPANKSAKASSLTVCNRSAVNVTFRVSISVGGGATANKDYFYYDTALPANSTFSRDVDWFMSSGDIVRCYGSTGNLSFNLSGQEL